jgi:hypothetical protein
MGQRDGAFEGVLSGIDAVEERLRLARSSGHRGEDRFEHPPPHFELPGKARPDA